MTAADNFYQITHRKHLYNLTVLDNIPSIIQNGILCYNTAEQIPHTSIALESVQARRESVIIPGGRQLHDYANAYFTYHNPMLYRIKDQADNLCILAVSAAVLDICDCIVSDRNAATDLVRFYSAEDGINRLDYEKIYAKYWNEGSYFEQRNSKAIKCAEVLVPDCIPYDYVVSACVASNEAAEKLRECCFDREVIVKSSVFYR